jgi:hypothetical protein
MSKFKGVFVISHWPKVAKQEVQWGIAVAVFQASSTFLARFFEKD